MKYAIVDNQKVEAKKGLKGICPICQQPVTPKCGSIKIHHWAHKSLSHCDKWWENETEWHRNWKNKFPVEWQEIVAFDEKTREKHIADVKTDAGMVVEFQHSYISNDERISREKFYKNMIWVVDGTRRKRDFEKFYDAINMKLIYGKKESNIWVLENGHCYLPKEWLNSLFPVVFDFKGMLDNMDYYSYRESLWCLLPISGNGYYVIIELFRDMFVKFIQNGGIAHKYQEIADEANEIIRLKNRQRRYGRYCCF